MGQQTNNTLSYENLGTHWYISIYEEISGTQKEYLNTTIRSYLESFENMYSRFRDDSIVSQLSKTGTIQDPTQELIDMLNFVIDIEEKSEGYFSILLADTLTENGYGKHTISYKPQDIVPLKSIITISSDKITLIPGYSIDFGGFGKGWAVDGVAHIIQNSGIGYAVINGGGDIRVLTTTSPHTLILEDPLDATKCIGNISVSGGGVAASNTQRRKRVHEGKSQHHLINPYTKQPVQSPLIAVHTYAKNTLMADVASTILFVCPLEKIEKIAEILGVEYFLVFDDYSTIRSKGYPWSE